MNTNEQRTRRDLVLAGGLAVALPSLLSRAWGAQARSEKSGITSPATDRLSVALESARVAGKPLLLILIPPEPLRAGRERLWGELFAFANDDALADFVLCEWACIEIQEFDTRFGAHAVEHLDVAALVEIDGEAPTATTISFASVEHAALQFGGYPIDEMRDQAARLATRLRARIRPDLTTLQRRRRQCERARGGRPRTALPDLREVERPRLLAYDLWAASLRAQERCTDAESARLTSILAAACVRRLWDGEIAGAEWKTEGVDGCPPCGMARMGTESRSFLQFYTAPTKR